MDDDDDNKFSGRFTPWSFGSWPRVYRDLFKYGNARPAVLRSLDLKGDERILDAGSGSGFYSIYLAKHLDSGKIVAVDQSKEMLAFLDRKARRKKLSDRIETHHGDLLELPLEDEAVDMGISIAVLHHIPEIRKALQELYRVIRPGGRLVVVDWDADDSINPHKHGGHDHGLHIDEFHGLLRETGFTNITQGRVKKWILLYAEREKGKEI